MHHLYVLVLVLFILCYRHCAVFDLMVQFLAEDDIDYTQHKIKCKNMRICNVTMDIRCSLELSIPKKVLTNE